MEHTVYTVGNEEFTVRIRPYPEGGSTETETDKVELGIGGRHHMSGERWIRRWANITMEGIFVVYGRRITK